MGKFNDLTGQRFGRLTVMKSAGKSSDRQYKWLCQCDCGKVIEVKSGNLHSGNTKSCGCLRKEQPAVLNATHGESKTRLYHIWCAMKDRCTNPHCSNYVRYGGRGITICDEWRNNYEPFRDWAMSHGYRSNLSIDRIDNDKGYCPENCRWATLVEQARNKRPRKQNT